MSAGTLVRPREGADGDPAAGVGKTAWSRCLDSRSFAYILFAILYIIPNIVIARKKLIWDDEFFTLYLSKTAGWTELWRAMSTGADQHPPSFYYLTHLIFNVAGTSHLTLRLTALFGFGLACVCLYEITRRLIGGRWAIAAALLPLTTPALMYATEARGYGLELGFVTFSLLMWILATEGWKRAWTVPALALGLGCAVASHYYAVLFLAPLAVGELAKMMKRRALDVAVCCALLGGLVPLIFFAPLLISAQGYSGHFWAVPYWGLIPMWYPVMLGRMLLILPAVCGLVFLLRIPSHGSSAATPEVPYPITVAVSVCAILPVLGGIVAQLITHASTERYFIAALPGTVILTVWGLNRMVRNNTFGPALTAALCLVLFLQQWREIHSGQVIVSQSMKSVAALLRKVPDAPIVIADVTVFHRLSFYGRRDLATRLVYLADPHLSVRYLGQDTVDRCLLALNPWFPLKTVWWSDWWKDHPFALVYGYIGEWNWVTFALPEVGDARLIERDISRLLMAVTKTHAPDNDRRSADPSGQPMLYNRLAAGGPSLCQIYMPGESCPVIDDPNFKAPIVSYPEMFPR